MEKNGLIYGPFCPNVLFLFSPKSTIFMVGNFKEYFFVLISVPHAVNGANIWQKSLTLGYLPKKTFDHLENKGSPLYEISESGDLWKNGFKVFKVIFVELDMRALIERLC